MDKKNEKRFGIEVLTFIIDQKTLKTASKFKQFDIHMVLAWEPSFTWNLNFRYENKPTKLQTIPVVPPSFPIKI